ncbi:MAG: stage III sporulation protein AF [Clostridia bacterium]|nr:stage III sporulation protein AF [Clostridia bacterium]
MNFIKDWAMTMATILILSSMCEVLLPDGGFRKYVRLSLGIMMVISLVSPLLGHGNSEWEPRIQVPDVGQVRQKNESVRQRDIVTVYQKNLEDAIGGQLRQVYGEDARTVTCEVEEMDPERFGTILSVCVELNLPESQAEQQRIARMLKENFGVEERKIIITFLKEQN